MMTRDAMRFASRPQISGKREVVVVVVVAFAHEIGERGREGGTTEEDGRRRIEGESFLFSRDEGAQTVRLLGWDRSQMCWGTTEEWALYPSTHSRAE